MIQTINRPLYTYDQFTNNPLKLLAQKYLPRKYLRKLWNAHTYSLNIPDKHTTKYTSLDNLTTAITINLNLEIWLYHVKHNIKIWYQPTNIRIEFKYIEDAVVFQLLWS